MLKGEGGLEQDLVWVRMGALQLRERHAPNTCEESELEERVCVGVGGGVGGW